MQNGSTNTTIRDLAIVGNHSAAGTKDACCGREHQHGIGVYSATDTLLERVDISRVGGDCVNIRTFGKLETWSDGVTLRDMTCRLTGRTGVVMNGASRVLIEDSVFDEIGLAVFGFEPNKSYQGSRDVTIRNNTIGSYSLTGNYRGFLLYANDAKWSDGPATIRNVTVTGNTVAGNRNGRTGEMNGLHVWVNAWREDAGDRFDFTVTDNTAAKAVAGPAIRIHETQGVIVRGNEQPLSSGALASFTRSTDVTYAP